MNRVRGWERASNYPHGAFVLHTQDKELVKTMKRRKGLSGMMVYSTNGEDVAWDLIFLKKAGKKYNDRLKNRLLNQCE